MNKGFNNYILSLTLQLAVKNILTRVLLWLKTVSVHRHVLTPGSKKKKKSLRYKVCPWVKVMLLIIPLFVL